MDGIGEQCVAPAGAGASLTQFRRLTPPANIWSALRACSEPLLEWNLGRQNLIEFRVEGGPEGRLRICLEQNAETKANLLRQLRIQAEMDSSPIGAKPHRTDNDIQYPAMRDQTLDGE